MRKVGKQVKKTDDLRTNQKSEGERIHSNVCVELNQNCFYRTRNSLSENFSDFGTALS
jgi:hypothetical protein